MIYKIGDELNLNFEMVIHFTKNKEYAIDEEILKGVIRGAVTQFIKMCELKHESDS